MAPNSPACSFIHASIAGSRSTAPLNRSNSVLIVRSTFLEVKSIDLVQALGQLNGDSPRVDDRRGGDVVHGRVSFLVRPNELDALRFERLAERLQILHFKSHVIDNAAGCGDVSDGLIAFPAEEVEAVSDARQVCANEEVGLPRTQSRIE